MWVLGQVDCQKLWLIEDCISNASPWENPMGGLEEKPMHDWESLSHVRWDCKYHVVLAKAGRNRYIVTRLE